MFRRSLFVWRHALVSLSSAAIYAHVFFVPAACAESSTSEEHTVFFTDTHEDSLQRELTQVALWSNKGTSY